MTQHCTVSWLSRHIWCGLCIWSFWTKLFRAFRIKFADLIVQHFSSSGANPLPLSFVTEKSAREWCYKRCVSLSGTAKLPNKSREKLQPRSGLSAWLWLREYGPCSQNAKTAFQSWPQIKLSDGTQSEWPNKTEAARYPEILTKILLKPKFWFECLPH